MIYPLRLMRSEDDRAPMDYSYVSSVSEGMRIQHTQNVHDRQSPSSPIVRHRANPEAAPVDAYGTRERRRRSQPRQDYNSVMTRLPSLAEGMPQAESVAYPPEYGIPDNPFDPPREPAAEAQPVQAFAPAQPAPQAPAGSRFEPPASPDIPDWLRVAQQNNLPLRRPDAPRISAAPMVAQEQEVDMLGRPIRRRSTPSQQPSDAYADAGYPEPLLAQQRQWEAEAAATPVRRRHGAQYAARQQQPAPQRQPAPSRTSYPPPRQTGIPLTPDAPPPMARGYASTRQEPETEAWQVETDDAEAPAIRIPWLAIASAVAVLAAALLLVCTLLWQHQTRQILSDRAEQQAAIAENNPYSYRELVESKARKYNLAPAFVAAIIRNESSFRPEATSSVGARGLMQLMDDTAQWIHHKMDLQTDYDFDALYDPETNVEFGCWYLNYLSERFYGDPILVAAAFHAGQNQVQNWLNDSTYSPDHRTLSIENMVDGPTRQYVTRVTGSYAIYKRLYYEATEEI